MDPLKSAVVITDWLASSPDASVATKSEAEQWLLSIPDEMLAVSTGGYAEDLGSAGNATVFDFNEESDSDSNFSSSLADESDDATVFDFHDESDDGAQFSSSASSSSHTGSPSTDVELDTCYESFGSASEDEWDLSRAVVWDGGSCHCSRAYQ